MLSAMLGLSVTHWMRFFTCGFAAGLALCFVRFGPIPILAVGAMICALLGMLVVTMYTRSYAPKDWRRWRVRARSAGRRLAATFDGAPAHGLDGEGIAGHEDPRVSHPSAGPLA